jgi:hypothetical protein
MIRRIFLPEWVLGDIKRDYSIGDRIDWEVSPFEHQGDDEPFGAPPIHAMYGWDPDEVIGTVSGTLISMQAVASTYGPDGHAIPGSMRVWPLHTTTSFWDGDTSVDAYVFDIEIESEIPAPS